MQTLLGPRMDRAQPAAGRATTRSGPPRRRCRRCSRTRGAARSRTRAHGRAARSATRATNGCATSSTTSSARRRRSRDYRNVVNGHAAPGVRRATRRSRRSRRSGSSEWREQAARRGQLSRRTVQKMLVLLHGILKRAKRAEWIASNPAEDVERVTVKRSGDFNVLSPGRGRGGRESGRERAGRRDLHGRGVHRAAARRAARAALARRRLRQADGASCAAASRTAGRDRRSPGKVRSVPLIDQAAARARRRSAAASTSPRPDDLVFCTRDRRAPATTGDPRRVLRGARGAGLGEKRDGRRPDRVPRPAPHVRDARGRGVAAARRAGVHGARGHPDDDDLRPPRAEGGGGGCAVAARGGGRPARNRVPEPCPELPSSTQLSATERHSNARKYWGDAGYATTHNPSRPGSSPGRAIEIAQRPCDQWSLSSGGSVSMAALPARTLNT